MLSSNYFRASALPSLWRYWRVIGTGLSFSIFGLGALLLGLALLLVIYPLPINPTLKQSITRRAISRATWVYVRFMRMLGLLSFRFAGVENLKAPGQLIVANHPSLLDVVFLISLMPDTNCIVKSALFRNPFTMGVVSMAGYIPNDREHLVERAAKSIAQGQRLIVFPEGTRTRLGEKLRFQRGAANIALAAGCPIRPVFVDCTPATLLKHQKWYDVPEQAPVFSFDVHDALHINDCIATDKAKSLNVRHLTRHLENYFNLEKAAKP